MFRLRRVTVTCLYPEKNTTWGYVFEADDQRVVHDHWQAPPSARTIILYFVEQHLRMRGRVRREGINLDGEHFSWDGHEAHATPDPLATLLPLD